eukprot:TRINITY_DN8846_c0_g4_i1.p1 TRINITY_DN8846_c0_g4~~TRINITY_DN8846_c0_g4_i1.p1  ORF type:complete len:545 (+),score=31.89 TRINITY_DN8846_c0_g4_i1:52-1686(+)
MGHTTHELVLLSGSSVFLCFVMWTICRLISYAEARSWICRSGRWVLGRINPFKSDVKPNEPDPVEQYVTKQMEVFRAGRVNLAHDIIICALSGFLLVACARILVHEKRVQSSQQDILVLATAFAALLPKHCRRLEPGKAVHVSYGLVMIFCIIFILLSNDSTSIFSSGQMAFIRLSFIPCGLPVFEVVFWNSLCSIGSVVRFAVAATSDQGEAGPHTVVAFEMFLLALSIAASEWFRVLAWSEMFRDAVAKSDGLQYDALGVLMDNVCDVTMPMDDKFVLSSDSKRFAALLMRDTRRSLKGTNVQDYMPFEDDKERFRNMFAHEDIGDKPVVACLNLSLRESSGTNIGVEVFCVRFKRIDDVPSYILGIRENAAERWLAPLRQTEQVDGQSKQKRSTRQSDANSSPHVTMLGASSTRQPADTDESQCHSFDSLFDSHCASTSSNDKSDAKQHLKPTGRGAKLQSMTELIAVWSVPAPGKMCCAYHATLAEAKNVLSMMRRGPCQPTFYDEDLLQCGACGILNDPKGSRQCTLCECDLLTLKLVL